MALLEIKRGRGRPPKPKPEDPALTELKKEIEQLKTINTPPTRAQNKDLEELIELIRLIQRAAKGLEAKDDVYTGLIDPEDIRERTRLDESALLSHSAMRVIAKELPEFGLFGAIADMEDPYYISQDGEGRREAIGLLQAKTRLDAANIINMNQPEPQQVQNNANPKSTVAKGKGLFGRIFKR